MNPQLEISIATEQDAHQLAAFMKAIIDENLPYIFPFPERFTDELQLKHIKVFAETDNAFLLIARNNNEIVGGAYQIVANKRSLWNKDLIGFQNL